MADYITDANGVWRCLACRRGFWTERGILRHECRPPTSEIAAHQEDVHRPGIESSEGRVRKGPTGFGYIPVSARKGGG